MILISWRFSSGVQRDRVGIRARTSDQFSRAWYWPELQRKALIPRARITRAVEACRIFRLSPPNSRDIRRLTSRARVRTETVSQGPGPAAAEAGSKLVRLSARLKACPDTNLLARCVPFPVPSM